ncbi:hypothetical protein ACQVQT_26255 [Bacillus paranthracis]|uniref:Fur-regulated basic protein FbpA n=2 Tax=Bacillus cereus group TaxID=86661 RepID=A0ABT6E316_9BACI|nr:MULTISPECIES: hypothetical protein [Bacillus]ACJ78817.1 hypothetical protein BCAH187_A1020 [Bacillus cereus AH187]EDZ57427.1 hypothetical protein BCH308197_0887 [Bacillus cereus H3081.97]EEL02001.1 hypothetical protein bcere0013_7860 [Bacillus cereus BDRD-ST26]KKZ91281.1 hypothetical protein B4086_0858 [Bacillus cereus]KLA03926.1 hypothetical protein B4153_0847 [Bacillus cereus]
MKRKIKKLTEEKKQLREQLKIAYADIYKKNLEYEGELCPPLFCH